MPAFGVYIQELRQGQGLTLRAVGEALGVSDRIVSAWEKAEHEPKVGVMPALLNLLRGSWDDAVRLLREDATEEQARQLARERLAQQEYALRYDQEAIIRGLSDEDLALLVEIASRLRQQKV